MKLGSIMIGSENPKALGEFYTKVLGQPGWQQDDWYGFGIGETSLMIGPHSEVKGSNKTPGRLIINFETENLQNEYKRIKDLGAQIIAEPYQPSQDNNPEAWLATFSDPDGNYFQLATPWKQ